MVIQTEKLIQLCFRHRRPPVSKHANSRGEQIISRGRIKWTFDKKMLNCLVVETTKTSGAFFATYF